MAFDCGDRHGEDSGDVVGQHVFLVAQNHDEPRLFRQGGDELLESSRYQGVGRLRGGHGLRSFVEAYLGQLAAALVIDATMSRHFAQPEFHVLFRL